MYDPLYNPNDPTGPRKSKFWALRRSARSTLAQWQWPLMKLGERDPIVLAEHINGTRRGIDLGYELRPYDAFYVPVFAVQSGQVMFAGETTNGFAVTLRHHGTEWASYYSRLSASPHEDPGAVVAHAENRRTQSPGRSDWVLGFFRSITRGFQ